MKMEFEKLIAEFDEATGIGLEIDDAGAVRCQADDVLLTVMRRPQSEELVIYSVPLDDSPADEMMMRHALELSFAGVRTGGFFLGLNDGTLTLSARFPLDGMDAETLGRRMLELSAATRRVAQDLSAAVAEECAEQVDSERNSSDACNQTVFRV